MRHGAGFAPSRVWSAAVIGICLWPNVSAWLMVRPLSFRPLVRGALETGARYGELCALTCGDYNPDSGTIHIKKSKSGKERQLF